MHPWPTRNVYFTGFMATGKSKIGELTAKSLGWKFIDTDKYIEELEGMSISDIFVHHGEQYFRTKELDVIRELSQTTCHVIALGGGAIMNPQIVEIVKSAGTLVRLWAPVEVISERISRKDTRPLMSGLNDEQRMEKIREMLKIREPFYTKADISIESSEDQPVHDTVKKIKNYVTAWNYKKVEVNTPSANYPIFIGNNFVDLFRHIFSSLDLNTDYLIVTDSNVHKKQKHNLQRIQKQFGDCHVFQFRAGESFKNLGTLNKLYTFMLNKGLTRKTTLIQFSGGVVGDMAGFGAATYQRGIPFVQVPTTLLSMVDSSVGGKVAVNHQLGKNMIGAFYQPRAVLINLEVLNTLDPQEYLAGLAEVVKYGVIWDLDFFEYLEENVDKILNRDHTCLEHIVAKCCAIKAEVVSQDEKEAGIRAILNYGHTFGHAIEKVTNYSLFSHGLAVALGMRIAARLATLLEKWDPKMEERQNKLLEKYGFPNKFNLDVEEAYAAMGIDKKAETGKMIFILPTKIGHVEREVNPPKELVNKAWESIF